MPIFAKNPEKTLANDRDTAKANADRLAVRLTDAEQAVIRAKAASQACALSGNDTGLDAAEATERAALQRNVTIAAAHRAAGQVLADLETQLAELTDKKVRAATAAAVNGLADELTEATTVYLHATARFNAVLTRAKAISWEATGLEAFAAASQTEVAAALPILTEVLRQHARAVLQGFAGAEMPPPEPAAVNAVSTPPAPSLTTVFATQPIKWLDPDGKQRSCGKGCDIELPTATAKRALADKVAVPLDHPSRKTDRGQWPGHVALAHCYDLDAAPPQQHASTVHSAFTVVDRGKPYALKVAGAAS